MQSVKRIKMNPGIMLNRKDFNIKTAWQDPTSRSLLFSNLILLILAVFENWPIINLLWIYLLQSLIIGFFVFLKILVFRNRANIDKIRIERNGIKGVKNFSVPVWTIQLGLALFFAFHYGFFHFVYTVFLVNFSKSGVDISQILIGGGIFFANHLYSFLANYHKDKSQMPKVFSLMISAYSRIVPMHIIIIAGGFIWGFAFPFLKIPILILFVVLKTFTDIKMHLLNHQEKPTLSDSVNLN